MENAKSGAIWQSIIKLANQFICAIKKVVKIQFSQLKHEEPIYQSQKILWIIKLNVFTYDSTSPFQSTKGKKYDLLNGLGITEVFTWSSLHNGSCLLHVRYLQNTFISAFIMCPKVDDHHTCNQLTFAIFTNVPRY